MNFNNIGKKIKVLATVSAIVGCVFFILFGILMYRFWNILGLCLLIGGPIFSWISCFVLYGFGQLVDNSDKLVALLSKDDGVDIKHNKSNNTIKENNATKEYNIIEENKKTEEKETIDDNNSIKEDESKNTTIESNIEEIDYTSQYKKVKKIIKKFSKEELITLSRQHQDWYRDIKKSSIIELFAIVEKEQDSYQPEFIYLCCFEIINKVKQQSL